MPCWRQPCLLSNAGGGRAPAKMCTRKAVAPDPNPGIASSMGGWVGPGCFILVFPHVKWADILYPHTQFALLGELSKSNLCSLVSCPPWQQRRPRTNRQTFSVKALNCLGSLDVAVSGSRIIWDVLIGVHCGNLILAVDGILCCGILLRCVKACYFCLCCVYLMV